MKMVKATIQDQEKMMALLVACVANMRANNIDQWNAEYPNVETMMKDIESEHLFVMKDNDAYYGIVTLNEEQEKEYSSVNWQCEGKILVVHRLAINPIYQSQGIGKKNNGIC